MPKNKGMSDFNLENPFVYLNFSTNQKLVEEIDKLIKTWMIMALLEVIFFILSLITWIGLKASQVDIIIGTSVLFVFALFQLRGAIRSNRTNEITDMIVGDEFTYKNVNNEELMKKITFSNENFGKVKTIRECIYVYDIIYLCLIIIQILRILIFIFR